MSEINWDRIRTESDLKVQFRFLEEFKGKPVQYSRDPILKVRFRYRDIHTSCMVALETDKRIGPGEIHTGYVSLVYQPLLEGMRKGDTVGIYLGFGTPDDDNAVGEVLEIINKDYQRS